MNNKNLLYNSGQITNCSKHGTSYSSSCHWCKIEKKDAFPTNVIEQNEQIIALLREIRDALHEKENSK